jgi:ketosteroid isomerase-like protein
MNNTTQETIKGYYDGIKQKSGWQAFVSDDIAFDGTGVKATKGKAAFVEGNNQFLRAVTTSQVKEMIVEGEKAYAIVHYELRSPKGNSASSDVAEILVVKNGKIVSASIYFDTAAFNTFMAQG